MVLFQIIISNFMLLILWYLLGYLSIGQFVSKIPRTLYLPLGFVFYEAVFWLPGFLSSQFHWSWLQLSFIVGTLLTIVIFVLSAIYFIRWSRGSVKKAPKFAKEEWVFIAMILLIGTAHGIFQMGFWNSDHSYSDNAFYLTVANVVKNAPRLFDTNLADGMIGSVPVAAYYITPYEMSLTFLSQFSTLSPAAFVQVTMPILGSIMTGLIFYELFKKLLEKPTLAIIGVVLFYLTVLFAPNYRSNIDDYTLTEWFTYYYYTGKALVHFMVAPLLIYIYMHIYEVFSTYVTTKKIIFYSLVLNVLSIGFFGLSPVAVIYVLALNFIFMFILLFSYPKQRFASMLLIFFGSLLAFIGLVFSYVIQSGMTKFTNGVSDLSSISILTLEHFSLARYAEFFIYPKTDAGYTFYRWMNVGMIVILIIFAFTRFIKILYAKTQKKINVDDEAFLLEAVAETKETLPFAKPSNLLCVFGIYFPGIFLLFVFLPPIMSIVSSVLGVFVHQRLVGSYIYEVVVLAWLLWIIDASMGYLVEKIAIEKISVKLKRATQWVLTFLSLIIVGSLFIAIPERPLPLDHALDAERQSRLRFRDDYYSGQFNFQLLLDNPQKTDAQAEEIYQVLQQYPGEKIVAGTINQFFGLSHLRVLDKDIRIVRTRYTDYNDEALNEKANILKYYLSPTDKSFEKYREDYTMEEMVDALKTFGVTHVVVLKSYKDEIAFGEEIKDALVEYSLNVDTTEHFYIINTQFTIE